MDAPRIVVIGAGISGLAFAWRCARLAPGARMTVLEASARAGGVIQTLGAEGCLLEAGPDCWAGNKPAGVELCRELGLEGGLIGVQPGARRSFILHKGVLKRLPEGFFLISPMSLRALAATGVLSLRGKLRMAMELFVPARADDADESLASFVRRRFGREALSRIAQPMIAGIYTADPEELSLMATFPQFQLFEREHGSVICALRRRARENTEEARAAGPRYGMFVTLRGGVQTLTDALAAGLPPGALRLGVRAGGLAREGAWRVRTEGGETLDADVLCLALPAPAAGRLLAPVDATLAARLQGIEYAGAAVVNFVFRRGQIAHPMDGIGAVIPAIENRRILAFSFSSVKFESRAPEGKAVVRVFMGGALQPEIATLPLEELKAVALEELRALIGISGEPLFAHASAHASAMAQYHVGHVERVAEIRALAARVPGLHLIGNAFDGVGIPDCIRAANEAAARAL